MIRRLKSNLMTSGKIKEMQRVELVKQHDHIGVFLDID